MASIRFSSGSTAVALSPPTTSLASTPRRLSATGELFYHAPNMPHAARTADEPVLAFVCLFGDVTAPPVLP